MKNKCVFLLTILVFLVPGMLLAPEPDKRFKVYVSVSSEDQKAFIESHIKRELRSLHDVEIASWDTAEYFLVIVALEGNYKSGQKTGGASIAYSWYTRMPVIQQMRAPKPDYLSDNGYKSLWDSQDKYNSFTTPYLGVMNCATKELDAVCKEIVVSFDQAKLESSRSKRDSSGSSNQE